MRTVRTASGEDLLCAALYAAEVGAPFDVLHAPEALLDEIFRMVPRLRATVAYAAARLLARLSTHPRGEVREGVARALPVFADLYLERVEELLLVLACDPQARVRAAAEDALERVLARLAELSDLVPLVERWRAHPDSGREPLASVPGGPSA
jgi:hypothetical protein